jgi:hypothetical protein
MTAVSKGMVRRRRRWGLERSGDMLDAAFVAVLVTAIPVAAGVYLYDRAGRGAAHARDQQAWVAAQPAMVARLKQPRPLEYGAVWATHSGRICGMVMGWGSFGGLSGMTPFYVWRGRPSFSPDVSEEDFAPGWRDCVGDPWIELVQGSMESGWCASAAGRKTCKWVGG